ncbi:hypothetical protein LTR49_027979, partial [Elasticomyces elasticus]
GSGRGGRDGEAVGATVFLKRNPCGLAPPTPMNHPNPADDQGIKHYLQGLEFCRLSMARELDAAHDWGKCGGDEILCDVCERGESPWDGPGEVLQRGDNDAHDYASGGLVRHRRVQMTAQFEMDEHMRRLTQVQGRRLLCRVLCPGSDWHDGLRTRAKVGLFRQQEAGDRS